MKKYIILPFFIIHLFSLSQNLYPLLQDQSGGIPNGYGAWGNETYIREPSVDIPGKGTVTFYHPDRNTPSRLPVVFFISGWEQTYEAYDKFLKFIASHGYAVVNIYNTNPGDITQSYPNALDMITQSAAMYQDWIDTTRVGLMGHSYGGGATIWLGKQIFDNNGRTWGTNGRFIIMFAPWLSFLVTAADLQNYPPNVKLLMIQSYDDLHGNGPQYNTDPRALRAVYELINIPDSEKDFITLYSDTDPAHEYVYQGDTYSYVANHYVIYTGKYNDYGEYQPYDAMDVYSANRLAHAMLNYVFQNDLNAKNVCLGNNSPEQRDMGIMPDLEATDYYVTTRPESAFVYKCSENAPGSWGDPSIWHLQAYCTDADGDGIIDALKTANNSKNTVKIYPNPARNFAVIHPGSPGKYTITVSGRTGKTLYRGHASGDFILDTRPWPVGIYFIHITSNNRRTNIKLIKEK